MLHCIRFNANKALGCGIFGRLSNFDKCRPEATDSVISSRFVTPFVLEKCVKFGDPSLKHSPEIPPDAVGGRIVDIFFAITSDRK